MKFLLLGIVLAIPALVANNCCCVISPIAGVAKPLPGGKKVRAKTFSFPLCDFLKIAFIKLYGEIYNPCNKFTKLLKLVLHLVEKKVLKAVFMVKCFLR